MHCFVGAHCNLPRLESLKRKTGATNQRSRGDGFSPQRRRGHEGRNGFRFGLQGDGERLRDSEPETPNPEPGEGFHHRDAEGTKGGMQLGLVGSDLRADHTHPVGSEIRPYRQPRKSGPEKDANQDSMTVGEKRGGLVWVGSACFPAAGLFAGIPAIQGESLFRFGVRSSEFEVRWTLRVALHGAHHHPDPKPKSTPTLRVLCIFRE
jgi:hypothetical protein